MWRRVPGRSGRYVNDETGETISRRRYETERFPERVRARDVRYRLERHERERQRVIAATVLGVDLPTYDQNKEYFRARWARQLAGTSTRMLGPTLAVEETYETLKRANSPFERLWQRAIREGFDASPGSAWDSVVSGAGMMTGYSGANQGDYARSHYLEYIRWLMERDEMENLGEPSAFDIDAA